MFPLADRSSAGPRRQSLNYNLSKNTRLACRYMAEVTIGGGCSKEKFKNDFGVLHDDICLKNCYITQRVVLLTSIVFNETQVIPVSVRDKAGNRHLTEELLIFFPLSTDRNSVDRIITFKLRL